MIPSVLWNTLYPRIDGENPTKCEDFYALQQYLKNWSCAPRLQSVPSVMDDFYDQCYEMEANPWKIRKVSVFLKNGEPGVDLETEETSVKIRVGLGGDWIANDHFIPMPRENDRLNMMFHQEKIKHWISGGWASDYCFVFQVRSNDWMDYHTFYCRFNGESNYF